MDFVFLQLLNHKGYLDCIQFRHRRYDLGSPSAKFPIHRALVVQVLQFPAPTLTRKRDCLAAALATVCCFRPSEGTRMQFCDVFFDFDVGVGITAAGGVKDEGIADDI